MSGDLQLPGDTPGTDSPVPPGRKTWRGRLQKITLIEWLVMAAIVGVVVALALPTVQSVRPGEISVPVEITVFDGQTLKPITAARVTIIRALPATGSFPPAEFGDRLSLEKLKIPELGGVTGVDGVARFEHRFRTGAKEESSQPHAHLNWYWVLVSADGFSPVGFPLRTSSVPTEKLREQGKLSTMVALYTATASESP